MNLSAKSLLKYFTSKFADIGKVNKSTPTAGGTPEYTVLKESLLDNMAYLQGMFDGCADFVSKEFLVCKKKAAVISMDNMVDKLTLTQSVLIPLSSANPPLGITTNEAILDWLRDEHLSLNDQREVFSYEEVVSYVMAGYAVLLIDGAKRGLAFGIQGYKYRSIDEPNTETVLRGSREGFVEPLRINLMLVRRRIKNPNLKFEIYYVGAESKTEICLAYIKGMVEEEMLNEVRHRVKTTNMDTVFGSGYIQSNFQNCPYSIFPTVGTTERPDTFCGRLNEGRIGIIVDNTPLALTVPFLFVENFQNMDDYDVGPYYATFTRILKYLAFFTSILVPGLYVAVGSFHQALLPSQLLYTLAQAEEATPFPLVFEAILMQIIYEMVREAGLRLPKQIGFAINIVGALIIGQSAVSAGLIGAPMVIIIALTATTTLIIPTLYESGVVLRLGFIILAGMSGMFGIVLGIAFLGFHLGAIESYGVPFTAPISPLSARAMRDVVVRVPWSILSKRKIAAHDMPGTNVDKTQG